MKISVLGPPASGKGTYSSRISTIFKIPHISTGDICRNEIAKKTPIGKEIEPDVTSGRLVKDDIIISFVKERLKNSDCKNGFIFDGFPRTMVQAEEFDEIEKIDYVVFLTVPKWLILKRLSTRLTCKNCGKIYNIRNIKPKKEGICDVCGGKLVRRIDEESEVNSQRLKTYKEYTEPLMDYYKKKGILLNVSCNNIDTPPEEMVNKILDMLGVKK